MRKETTENLKKECVLKIILYAIVFTLLLSQTVIAGDATTVQELIKCKLDAVTQVLQKKDLAQDTKNKEILEIVMPIFDFSLMAKLTLGKKYWPGLSEEKKDRFTELFVKRLKNSYLEKLTLYSGDEKIVFKDPVSIKKKIHIPTELISQDNKISMLYKLYKSKNNWKIYDIEVEGVSIVQTYRSQFDQVLQSGSIDDLLLKLEQQENKPPLSNSSEDLETH